MKTFFLFHDNELQYLKADWAAARYPFDGFVVISRERAWWGQYLWRRARRIGFFKVLDELLLRLYWVVVKGPSDRREMRRLKDEIRADLPADYERPPVHKVGNINGPEGIELLQRLQPDVCVLMVSPILNKKVFSIPPLGMLVFHPGVTPEYKGPHSAFWATLREEYWGIGWSLLRVDEGIDTGPVLAQGSAKNIDPLHDSHVIMQHVSHIEGLAGVIDTLRQLEAGESPRVDLEGREGLYHTHPGISDYLKLRKVLRARRKATIRT